MPDHIPSDEMYKYIDCRYTGVVLAAKRARQLMLEDPTNAKGKPLLRAFDELMSGKLRYRVIQEDTEDLEKEETAVVNRAKTGAESEAEEEPRKESENESKPEADYEAENDASDPEEK